MNLTKRCKRLKKKESVWRWKKEKKRRLKKSEEEERKALAEKKRLFEEAKRKAEESRVTIGKYTLEDDAVYEGEMKNGKPNGKGEITYGENDSKKRKLYEGQVKKWQTARTREIDLG